MRIGAACPLDGAVAEGDSARVSRGAVLACVRRCTDPWRWSVGNASERRIRLRPGATYAIDRVSIQRDSAGFSCGGALASVHHLRRRAHNGPVAVGLIRLGSGGAANQRANDEEHAPESICKSHTLLLVCFARPKAGHGFQEQARCHLMSALKSAAAKAMRPLPLSFGELGKTDCHIGAWPQ